MTAAKVGGVVFSNVRMVANKRVGWCWSNPRADYFNQGKVTFHLSVKLPPLNVPSSFSVRFPPGGLLVPVPEKVITVVAHCPGPRFPNARGTGPPFVVGEKSVAAVSLTLFAVTEPLF